MANTSVFRVPELEGPSVGSDPTIVRFWVDVRDWRTIIVDGPHAEIPPVWTLALPIDIIKYTNAPAAIAAGEVWADRTENAK